MEVSHCYIRDAESSSYCRRRLRFRVGAASGDGNRNGKLGYTVLKTLAILANFATATGRNSTLPNFGNAAFDYNAGSVNRFGT